MTNHFIDLPDIPAEILKNIIKDSHGMKAVKFSPPQLFEGLSLAMVFDKRSTRTRMSFEVAMKQLGGHTIVMSMEELQLTGAESIQDTGAVLSRYVDAVMIRMSDHETLKTLAKSTSIPVINGLTDYSHPCQIMADIMTVEEKLETIENKKVAWFGDFNNVARTWAQAADIWDFDLYCAVPPELFPEKNSFKNTSFTEDPLEAADNAHIVITDTWVSMGQEEKSPEVFCPYQVNKGIMNKAATGALFMHCMPVHRGKEVTDEILASNACIIYDEAENRLHAQKAILSWCMQDAGVRIV